MKNFILITFVFILNACDSKSCDTSNSNNNNQENIDIEPSATKPDSSKKPEISTKADDDTNIISAEEESEKITPKIIKPLPANTEEEIKNNLTKAIEDNNESLLDGVQRKFITPEVVETAIKKDNLSVIKKLYAINGDIFKDKNKPLFLSSSNKEIKEFIANNSSYEAKEKYVKTNLKTDEGIENLKKAFTDLEPSTINGFLWPIKDDGVKIAPSSILKDTLIKNDDSEKLSKLLEVNIDLDKKDNDGNNLLHYAAQQNKPKVFKVLFDKKNSLLKTKNDAKNTPLQTALKTNSKDVIKFIINNAVLDEEEQKEIIVYALEGMVNQSDKKEILEELVKKYPKIFNSSITLNNKNGLALFLTKNYTDIIYKNTNKNIIYDDIIKNLANNNYVNNFIHTIRTLSKDNASELLHYKGENSLMTKFINDDYSYLLKKLTKLSDIEEHLGTTTNLDTSVFIDAKNNNILHQAALLNKPKIFEEFLDKTMLNAKNTDGKTALEIALEGKNSQIITSLLNNRYKIDMDDKSYQEIIKHNPKEWGN